MKRILLFVLTNILVVATLSIVLSLLGVRGYITAYGIDYQQLLIFCLVWGFGGAFISLFMSKFMAKMMMGVKIVDGSSEFAPLVNKIHLIARQAGLPKMPEVGVYQSPEVNAFATGPSKSNSLVAVSTGLLNSMSDEEVEGVLAHEVAHIANGDMVTMTLLQGVINAFVMFLSRIAAFALSQAMRSNDDERDSGPSPMMMMGLTFLFEMLFGFLGMFIIAGFSRHREFKADHGGATLAGRQKMIAALKKLQKQMGHMQSNNDAVNAMKISTKKSWFALLSTHPPLDERIARLENYR